MTPDSRHPANDDSVRAYAVDTVDSCIVQAPAGAGKTELLIQRMLRLLATVDEPEEIVALTFTRKAAGEMRERLFAALMRVRGGVEPKSAHRRRTHELAKAALSRSDERGWQLDRYPARLNVGTIDALNATIAGRSPVATGGMALNTVNDQPRPLYELAAERTIGHIADGDSTAALAARALLSHLGNRVDKLAGLLADMLARRDQWLRRIGRGDDSRLGSQREELEANLGRVVDHLLAEALSTLPDSAWPELAELTRKAAMRLSGEPASDQGAWWITATEPPPADHAHLDAWQFAADVWSTKDGKWRRTLDKRQGFPTDDKEAKSRALALLESLRDGARADGLELIRRLPRPVFPDEQWEALAAALTLLPVAAAELKLVFRDRGESDYAEVASDALAALGDEGAPTDLALILDYRIRHILVDEFQDTSRAQYDLISALVRGWVPGDGRSLFVVGDPMQSIYRFREADVGLYLHAWDNGIGDVPLRSLTLTRNFRSTAPIVEWVNRTFEAMAPPTGNDPFSGAVGFSPSVAVADEMPGDGARIHVDPTRADVARRVLDIVRETLQRGDDSTVGILVRSRRHAVEIVRALADTGIDYSGAELDPLLEMSFVQDLVGLTRAICHPADRIAWLAVLRAPWCGMSVSDIETLANVDREACIPDILTSPELDARLSEDGAKRMARLRETLLPVVSRRGTEPLEDLVHSAWQRMGGPATLDDEVQLIAVGQYFARLAEIDVGGDYGSIEDLLDGFVMLTGESGPVTARVRIMTMHKAKGLEFDVVVLPGLELDTASDKTPVLDWREVTTVHGPELILSPIEAYGGDSDPLFRLIRSLQKEQSEYELDRLLYVAATRARHRLHVALQISPPDAADRDAAFEPRSGTLLSRLWPAIREDVAMPVDDEPSSPGTDCGESPWLVTVGSRFEASWRPITPPDGIPPADVGYEDASGSVVFDWATREAMQIGRAVHLWLRAIGEDRLEDWDTARIAGERAAVERTLRAEGTGEAALEACCDRVIEALTRSLEDAKGRWILDDSHPESWCEFGLVVQREGHWRRLVIDRVFVDGTGQTWIVDYKTSRHEGGDLEHFLAEETERYRGQLTGYAEAWKALRGVDARTGLYFPLLGRFVEVS